MNAGNLKWNFVLHQYNLNIARYTGTFANMWARCVTAVESARMSKLQITGIFCCVVLIALYKPSISLDTVNCIGCFGSYCHFGLINVCMAQLSEKCVVCQVALKPSNVHLANIMQFVKVGLVSLPVLTRYRMEISSPACFSLFVARLCVDVRCL